MSLKNSQNQNRDKRQSRSGGFVRPESTSNYLTGKLPGTFVKSGKSEPDGQDF
jgi:hypothetical protein